MASVPALNIQSWTGQVHQSDTAVATTMQDQWVDYVPRPLYTMKPQGRFMGLGIDFFTTDTKDTEIVKEPVANKDKWAKSKGRGGTRKTCTGTKKPRSSKNND